MQRTAMTNTAVAWRGAVALVLTTLSALPACSDDSEDGGQTPASGGAHSGTGGGSSSGGTKASGGSSTTGGTSSGGKASGGTSSGGKASGGTDDGGPDDGGLCKAPSFLAWDKPGCDGTVAPFCWNGIGDACLTLACACDGTELAGCGVYDRPWRRAGACADGSSSIPDSGTDAN